MATNKVNNKIAALLQKGEWAQARALLERERDKEPDNHWVLTQLGVTYYEQGRYDDEDERERRDVVVDVLVLLRIA